jgi:hypothetical protein
MNGSTHAERNAGERSGAYERGHLRSVRDVVRRQEIRCALVFLGVPYACQAS